jgi:hypothetical protein
MSLYTSELHAKRVELLDEFVPAGAPVGMIVNPKMPDTDPQVQSDPHHPDRVRQRRRSGRERPRCEFRASGWQHHRVHQYGICQSNPRIVAKTIENFASPLIARKPLVLLCRGRADLASARSHRSSRPSPPRTKGYRSTLLPSLERALARRIRKASLATFMLQEVRKKGWKTLQCYRVHNPARSSTEKAHFCDAHHIFQVTVPLALLALD